MKFENMRRLLSTVRRAVDDYDMIQEGDKIAIGISGGKDSMALATVLHDLRIFYPKKFELVAITADMGFTADMKAYKADPTAFPGTVADISTFIRVAVTGKTNSPDLYSVMQILGYERTCGRIRDAIASLR